MTGWAELTPSRRHDVSITAGSHIVSGNGGRLGLAGQQPGDFCFDLGYHRTDGGHRAGTSAADLHNAD